MPIFEYKCDACGNRFEELVRSSSPQNIACQGCGSTHVQRAVSIFGFATKGASGETTKFSGSGGSCSSCSSHHCSHCH